MENRINNVRSNQWGVFAAVIVAAILIVWAIASALRPGVPDLSSTSSMSTPEPAATTTSTTTNTESVDTRPAQNSADSQSSQTVKGTKTTTDQKTPAKDNVIGSDGAYPKHPAGKTAPGPGTFGR